MSVVESPIVIENNDNLHEQIKSLLHDVKNWPIDEIQIELLSGGYINLIVRCCITSKPDEILAVRIFTGNITTLKTTNREIAIVKALNKNTPKPIPAVHATFENGYVFDFYQGKPLNSDFNWFKDDVTVSAFTKSLVSFHLTDVKETSRDFNVYDDIRSGVSRAPAEQWIGAQKAVSGFPEKDKFIEALNFLENHLKNYPLSKKVLCHGDCHLANALWNFKDDHVVFVDMELSRYNFQAIDISYHFLSMNYPPIRKDQPLPYDDNDESRENFERNWIKLYLQHWFEQTSQNPGPTDDDITFLHNQVKKYSLLTCLMVMTWMTLLPNVEGFEYHGLTRVCYDHYKKNKDAYLSIQP